ncbi:MAG: MarR family winged helix-turn-helix transcriptional regulator [Beijerinckiaceae bacterium]
MPDFEMIELFFFAYRDFVGEPDRVLERFGFGRAHHRVLHFVNRHPGLTIAALLDILQITKQSLARVLKDLIENGHVEQRAGVEDRRQRCLYLTPAGAALAGELAEKQGRRIQTALANAPPDARQTIRAFLMGLIDPAARRTVSETIGQKHLGKETQA